MPEKKPKKPWQSPKQNKYDFGIGEALTDPAFYPKRSPRDPIGSRGDGCITIISERPS